MKNFDLYAVDYLILANIINSSETEHDIVEMVKRFIDLRSYSESPLPLNIQNPPSETE